MHKAFPLLVRKFPLPEGTSYCLKKNATARRKVLPLPEVCTAIIVKEKPPSTMTTSTTSGDKLGRTVTLTTEDIQKKKNDATKKTKKNLLKQQYENFRAEGSETLEQTFTRLQVIVGRSKEEIKAKYLEHGLYLSTKHSRGNDEVNTASVYTASSNVPTASANVATVSISQETTCAYIASQSGFDKSKVECFNCHKMGHFERKCRAPKNQERGRRDTYKQGSKAEEQTPKALITIDGVGWDWSYMENDEEDHAIVAKAPTEFALMADTSTENKVFDNSLCSKDCKKNNNSLNSKIINLTDKLFDAKNMIYHYKLGLAHVESRLVEYKEREVKYIEKIRTFEFYDKGKVEYIETPKNELETLKQEKEVVDGKLVGLLLASKNLDNLIESQRSSPTVESSSEEDQNKNPSASENVASPITPKQFVKFVKASDSQSKSKTDEKETPEKPPVKNAEQYRKPNKKPNVIGNQKNWNNLKSHQLGPDFVMKKKACFNCGDFNHLAYECRKRVKRGTTRNFSTGDRNFPTVNKKFSTASRKFPTSSTKGPTADIRMKGKA
nr:ribonuclease H-like domain-containing protein [Tanacetum cinerariifolium]